MFIAKYSAAKNRGKDTSHWDNDEFPLRMLVCDYFDSFNELFLAAFSFSIQHFPAVFFDWSVSDIW